MVRLIALILFLIPTVALAVERALVIGNDNYSALPVLAKAEEDAQGYARLFTEKGFEVTTILNAPMSEMRLQLARFYETVQPGDTVAFVYSGHGWSDGAQNYLVPVDAQLTSSAAVAIEMSVPLKNGVNGILDNIAARDSGLTIAVVDACRNNPFGGHLSRAVGVTRGLAPIEPARGTFLVYSAGAGQAALDRLGEADTQEFSVFTRFFIRNLENTGDLRQATILTRTQVQQAASIIGTDQSPAYYDELIGTSCLFGECGAAQDDNQVKGVIEEWAFVSNSQSRVVLNAFIQKWADEPLYVALAQEIIDGLPVVQTTQANDPPEAPERASAPVVVDSAQQKQAAINFVRLNIQYWAQVAPNIGHGVAAFYADEVLYNNQEWTAAQIIADKEAIIKRWPVRAYDLDTSSIQASCVDVFCDVDVDVVFFTHSSTRGATERGKAAYSFSIDMQGDPAIFFEDSWIIEHY